MWWGIGFGGFFIYLVLLITLGVLTLRNGHTWLFVFGIFIPFLWIHRCSTAAAAGDGIAAARRSSA